MNKGLTAESARATSLGAGKRSDGDAARVGAMCFVDPKRIAQSVVGEELLSLVDRIQKFQGGLWNLAEHKGASDSELAAWERLNRVKLPQDFCQFVRSTNGIAARWVIPLAGRLRDVGTLTINSLNNLKRIDTEGNTQFQDLPANFGVAFALQDSKGYGTSALVYFKANQVGDDGDAEFKTTPQIWFKDLAESWHFCAYSFNDYLRLVFSHFGIRGWQYAFTPVGLEPEAQQWLRLLSPQRLRIDQRKAIMNKTWTPLEHWSGDDTSIRLAFLDDVKRSQSQQQEKAASQKHATKPRKPKRNQSAKQANRR